MNDKRVASGAFVWFLGVLVPAAHHAILFATTAGMPTTSLGIRSNSLVGALPLFDWVYLIAMTLVGAALVVSGFRNKVAP